MMAARLFPVHQGHAAAWPRVAAPRTRPSARQLPHPRRCPPHPLPRQSQPLGRQAQGRARRGAMPCPGSAPSWRLRLRPPQAWPLTAPPPPLTSWTRRPSPARTRMRQHIKTGQNRLNQDHEGHERTVCELQAAGQLDNSSPGKCCRRDGCLKRRCRPATVCMPSRAWHSLAYTRQVRRRVV